MRRRRAATVPAGTPAPVVRRLFEASARPLGRAAVRERIAQQGMDAAPSASPEAFAAALRAEAPLLVRQVRDSGARLE